MSEDNPEEKPSIPPEDPTISESIENEVVDEEIAQRKTFIPFQQIIVSVEHQEIESMSTGSDTSNLTIIRTINSFVSLTLAIAVFFGIQADLTTRNIVYFILIVTGFIALVLYIADQKYRAYIQKLLNNIWSWFISTIIVVILLVINLIRLNATIEQLDENSNELSRVNQTLVPCTTQVAECEIQVESKRNENTTLSKDIETLSSELALMKITHEAQLTIIATLQTPAPIKTEEALEEAKPIFSDAFSSETIDRNLWSFTCNTSEYLLHNGELHFNVQGSAASETCVFKPKITEDKVVNKIEFTLTIKERTNYFGWLGVFIDCEDKYISIIGNSNSIRAEKQYDVVKEIEVINTLPIQRVLTIEKNDGEIVITSRNIKDNKEYTGETLCYSQIEDIRFGILRVIDEGGSIFGAIDDVLIWAD